MNYEVHKEREEDMKMRVYGNQLFSVSPLSQPLNHTLLRPNLTHFEGVFRTRSKKCNPTILYSQRLNGVSWLGIRLISGFGTNENEI